MRKTVLVVGLGLWLGVGLQLHAQQDEARALVAKAIEAHGGAKRLEATKAVTIKGKGKAFIMGMELPFGLEASVQEPDKLKNVIEIEVNGMTLTVVQVVNGKKGWNSTMGKTTDMTEKELKEAHAIMQVERVANLIALRDRRYKLSPLGEVKVGDWDTAGVRVTKEGTRDVNLYFDKKTHLLRKTEYQGTDPTTMMEVMQEKLFPNYKDMGGLKVPTKLIVNNDGKRFLEIEVSDVTPVEKLDDSVFAKP